MSMKHSSLPILRPAALLAAALGLAACDEVAEGDRLIYVQPPQVGRAVLIEDFTGQRCVNCPKATDLIHDLQQEYGDSAVIAVGIHSGPFGKNALGTQLLSLATETGNEYFDYWKVDAQPKGVVNRQGTSDYTDWNRIVYEALQDTATLSLALTAAYDAATDRLTATVRARGTRGTTDGRLQLWIVEDSITDVQLMPDGSTNRTYVHNHVFRTAVNGTWGTAFRIDEGETAFLHEGEPTDAATFAIAMDATWVPQHVSVVAFVYGDGGVAQVTRAALAAEWTDIE